MAVYNIAPIFKPQFVSNAAAALVFAPTGVAAVPAGFAYRIDTLRVANVTSAPVTLKVWLVPSGSTDDNEHIVVPITVLVPVASNTFPQFDVTALWGDVLQAGDAVWAIAGSASALTIHGSGLVAQG